MAKPNKKLKAAQAARRLQIEKQFDENALEKLTSHIDQNLAGNQQKRKNPPSTDNSVQDRKKQRSDPDRPSGKGKSPISTGRDILLAEIKALGGDEKDLELVQGIDSDEDDEDLEGTAQKSKSSRAQDPPVDKGLRDELAALSKQLGLADYQPSEGSEEEDEGLEDEEELDNDEVEEDEDEEDVEISEEDTPQEQGRSESHGGQQAQPLPKKAGHLTFEPRADWHSIPLPKLPQPSTERNVPPSGAMESLKAHARSLLDEDAVKYRTSFFATSSHKFLSTIMSSGTLTDKVSALTLAIQESPVHNIRAFEALATLASKKSRAQAIGAIGALVDLLGPGSLLPSERRLRYFASQPELLGALQKASVKAWSPGQKLPGQISEAHLIGWAYEDWLKDAYFKLIQLLESWCADEIEYSRSRALDFVYGLLKDKPEQESNLLRLLVNKLGDRDRKIASRASYLLLQLETSHPGMKPIIVRTIEQEILLHRSQDHRSKYYAVNTLNQTILSSKEPTVAEALVRIYFDLFVTLLKAGNLGLGATAEEGAKSNTDQSTTKSQAKPQAKSDRKPEGKPAASKSSEQGVEAADKLVSALLTGVNRAAPFVGTSDAIMENHMSTLFKIAHSANFNTGIQALLLIQHLASARSLATDRFYRTLYESLLDPRLVSSSKQSLYLNLLLRALKNDVDVRRVKAFAKRMLQVASLHQPPFVCGLLYILAHLRGTFPDLQTLIEDPEESIFDDEPAEQRPVYDGRKRDPEYSNAQRSCLWELIPAQAHFHPSVSVFAAALADKGQKVQKPDLESHSLIKFLDKFVYRNPKASDTTRGTSIMQPLRAAKDAGDIWLGGRSSDKTNGTINSATFWNKKQENVAAEDVFFHEYFQQAGKETKHQTKSSRSDGVDGEDDENGEDEVWKALVSTQPEVDGGDDGSEGFEDLDDDEMASDDDSLPFDLDDMSDDDASGSDVDMDGELGDDDVVEDDDDGLVAINAEEDSEDGTKESQKKEKDERRARRKKLRELPTFASVDDYAELLGQEEDERYD